MNDVPETPLNASVNRITLVDLPGVPVDAEVRGQLAYCLLSAEAVLRYAQPWAEPLQLPADDAATARLTLPRYIADCVTAPDPHKRAAAEAIAERLGRNLGYLLLTLRRGDAVNRAARPDWGVPEWARWGRMQRVWLGGGLAQGAFGARLIAHARALLAQWDALPLLQLELTYFGGHLAVVGAARYLPATTTRALCCDFGHTLVKRAWVTLHGGVLVGLDPLPPVPVPCLWRNYVNAAPELDGAWVRDFVADTVAQALAESPPRGASTPVLLSIAAYIYQGQLHGNGLYARMQALAPDVGALLEQALAARGWPGLSVALLHDGAAAASVYAGERDAAVLMLGTALGVGFPPPTAAGLRPLAAELTF